MLGYGIPQSSMAEGLKREPQVLAIDAGSTDPGPYYLGAGVSFTNRNMVKQDLELILEAAYRRHIPALIGSAGGAGGRPHLEWLVDIVREVAAQRDYHFKAAIISGEIDKETVKDKVRQGKVRSYELDRPLTEVEVERSTRVVGQMGVAPFIAALDRGAQLIIAGRACDASVVAAYPVWQGFSLALSYHMGKILECGAAAAYPRHGSDSLLGYIYDDCFLVEPPNPDKVCTVASVAAHSLYERSNPYVLHLPEGTLDLSHTQFQQADDRRVKIWGTRFAEAKEYTIKIEGAARVGFRTITIAGIRDPILIDHLDDYLTNVRQRVATTLPHLTSDRDYRLLFHIYGRDGVMGPLEPQKTISSQELGLVIEVVAPREDTSRTVCAIVRSVALHSTYPGRKAIAGNLAFPFSPSDIPMGDVYEFNIYHLIQVDPEELFPITMMEI
ncbi:MAG: acyclic terpene utilization AtuA family protein [Chloroflexi bacterium]|nr:acyclic terpene utilization AtuA family protein [Chloroflexota bacterium]